jgi:hypothetical protein
VVVVAEELQEQLLAQEEELRWGEEAPAAWEQTMRISEKSLTKAEVTQKEHLDKLEIHTARPKHSALIRC